MLNPSRQLPNFFVLGAKRAGTASLTHYLQQHRSITFTEPRATHFFENDTLFRQDLDFYLHSFCRHTGGYPWRGEASPGYFARPHVVGPRLRAQFGDAPLKFIVLLREPVARAWSHYLLRVRTGHEKRSFATALAQEEPADITGEARYFAEGCYVRLLEEWQSYYPLEDFLLLLSEDLAADPLAQVQRVFTWLGVDTTVTVNVSKQFNRSGYDERPGMVRLLQTPHSWLRTIGERIWPNLWRRQHHHHISTHNRNSIPRVQSGNGFNTPHGELPAIEPTVAEELRQRYQPEVLALSKLLGRYLSHWLPSDELPERSTERANHQ